MNQFYIFNINVASEINLLNIPSSSELDNELKIISVDKSPLINSFKTYHRIISNGKTLLSYLKDKDKFGLRFHNYADFLINPKKKQIECFKRKQTSNETLSHLITDQVIPYALSLNGNMLFHSSAVKIGNKAISFLAPSGSGKSTIAAYFCKKKHQLITDDSLLLKYHDNDIYAYPSYPGLRLWPDIIDNIYSKNIITKKVSQINNKRFLNPDHNSEYNIDYSIPLKSIYFINNTNKTNIENISPSDAFSLIIKNIFRADIKNKNINKKEFEFIINVLSFVGLYKLNYEMRYESMDNVYNLIMNHSQT